MKERKRMKNRYKICGDYTIIYLPKKTGEIYETKINTEDLDKLIIQNLSWNATYDPKMSQHYVQSTEYLGIIDGKAKYKIRQLAREIVEAKEDEYVDHKNHDTLDNRRNNLRITKFEQNAKNRKGKNKNNKSGYRNVH